jgi:hypothetical protein
MKQIRFKLIFSPTGAASKRLGIAGLVPAIRSRGNAAPGQALP